MLRVLGNITPLPNIQTGWVGGSLSITCLRLTFRRLDRGFSCGDTDVRMADVEGKSDWKLSDLTDDLDFGHPASITVEFDYLQKVCLIASLSFSTSIVDLICLGVHSVPELPGRLLFKYRFARFKRHRRPETSV